jgi:hypothetical protein
MTLWTWEHAVLWLAAAAACWLAVLSGGCTLLPQSAVAPAVVPLRPVTVMAEPWWVHNADAFIRSREPVE